MFKNKNTKKDLLIASLLALICLVGVIFTTKWQFNNLSPEVLKQTVPENTSLTTVMLLTIIQGTITIFIMSFLGVKLSRKINLNKGIINYICNEDDKKNNKFKLNKNDLIFTLISALLFAAIISLSEKFIWPMLIPEISGTVYSFDLYYIISAVLYGGIAEEIMMRLFTMSLIVLILWKLFARNMSKENIPNSIYWISIIISALLFALGHYPATALQFNVTIFVILRMLILNGLGGVIFGYLYWKKGLEYSITSHMFSHLFMQLVLFPILF